MSSWPVDTFLQSSLDAQEMNSTLLFIFNLQQILFSFVAKAEDKDSQRSFWRLDVKKRMHKTPFVWVSIWLHWSSRTYEIRQLILHFFPFVLQKVKTVRNWKRPFMIWEFTFIQAEGKIFHSSGNRAEYSGVINATEPNQMRVFGSAINGGLLILGKKTHKNKPLLGCSFFRQNCAQMLSWNWELYSKSLSDPSQGTTARAYMTRILIWMAFWVIQIFLLFGITNITTLPDRENICGSVLGIFSHFVVLWYFQWFWVLYHCST